MGVLENLNTGIVNHLRRLVQGSASDQEPSNKKARGSSDYNGSTTSASEPLNLASSPRKMENISRPRSSILEGPSSTQSNKPNSSDPHASRLDHLSHGTLSARFAELKTQILQSGGDEAEPLHRGAASSMGTPPPESPQTSLEPSALKPKQLGLHFTPVHDPKSSYRFASGTRPASARFPSSLAPGKPLVLTQSQRIKDQRGGGGGQQASRWASGRSKVDPRVSEVWDWGIEVDPRVGSEIVDVYVEMWDLCIDSLHGLMLSGLVKPRVSETDAWGRSRV